MTRTTGRAALAAAVVLGMIVAGPARAALTLTYSGEAFGTFAVLGTTVRSGKTAPVGIGGSSGGCAAGKPVAPPVLKRGTVASLDTPFLDTGVITTSLEVFAEPAPSDVTGTRATAQVAGVDAMNGLVTADLIKAVSTTTHSAIGGFSTSADGTALVGLRVAGVPIAANAPPNTELEIPGVARVVLNEQVAMTGPAGASLLVIGLHIFVTESDPTTGVKEGDQIIIANARSAVKVFDPSFPTPRRVSGLAYGTMAQGTTSLTSPPSAFRSSPTAPVSLPCLGTDGDVRHNTVVDVNVPNGSTPVIAAETIHTTATGLVTSLSAETELTAKTEGLSLLDGLISADLVKAVAHCLDDLTVVVCDDQGSALVNLVVDGEEIDASTPPNTVIDLGFAKVHVHRVLLGPTAVEVRMIEVVITDDNPFDLGIKTVIQVSVARTAIASAS